MQYEPTLYVSLVQEEKVHILELAIHIICLAFLKNGPGEREGHSIHAFVNTANKYNISVLYSQYEQYAYITVE
jgi:hypothetical protein